MRPKSRELMLSGDRSPIRFQKWMENTGNRPGFIPFHAVVLLLLLCCFYHSSPCALMIKFDGGEGGCGTCWTLVLPHTEHTQSHGQPRKAMSLLFVSVSKKNIARGTTDPPGYWVLSYLFHWSEIVFMFIVSCRDNSSFRLNILGPVVPLAMFHVASYSGFGLQMAPLLYCLQI